MIDLQILQGLLAYDPATGILRWRVNRKTVKAGQIAGHVEKSGYRRIRINGENYPAHRIAWFLTHGNPPSGYLDHANCNKDDNRLENLREATQSQNNANRRGRNSGLKGAHWHKIKKLWISSIRRNGVSFHLGYFETEEGAHAAYVAKATEMFGEFARPS